MFSEDFSVFVDLSSSFWRYWVPLVTLDGGLVWVPLVDGERGVRSGGMLQSGERGLQTRGSGWWRTSNGGRVLRISRSIGINLQTWWSSTGENLPRESKKDSFRPSDCLSKKVTMLLMLRSRVTNFQKAGLFIPGNVVIFLREIMTSVVCLINLQWGEDCYKWSCCAWIFKRANCQARVL